MSDLRLEDAAKIYNEGSPLAVHALQDINLTIHQGEMVAITGASGSGKSTLLHILGCLDHLSKGHYYMDDADVSAFSNRKLASLRNQKFGFVLQEFGLLLNNTSKYNVSFPLVFNPKYRFQRIDEKIEAVLDRLGIIDKTNIDTKYLSGGQKQRVAIARAIVNDPDIILADEPTGSLDSKTGGEILEIFNELNQQGKTIVMVTHDLQIAACCERQIKIVDGRIVE